MTPERWGRVKEVFGEAVELPAGEREAFVREACGADAGLASEVRRLIEADARADSPVETPLFGGPHPEATVQMEAPLTGLRVAGFELSRRLGAGGMGEVYLAQDPELKRPVAVKLLREEFTRDPARVARFEREAYAASALNHPYVLHVYKVGEQDGRRFIVTEYVEGQTLRRRAAAGLRPEEALRVATQVSEAVAAAHRAGIVHRDIKPENVMVRPDGYVKVLDFGIAKLAEGREGSEGGGEDAARTETGVVVGTARYMSPEQARGVAVDERTDVWSIGVVLYEMLTGRAPFDGPTNTDVIVSILEREPEPLASLLPGAPPELQRIVSKALRKQREKRYRTADDLALDLENLLHQLIQEGGGSFEARPVATAGVTGPHDGATRANAPASGTASTSGHFARRLRRHKLAAVAACLALLLASAAAFYGWRRLGAGVRPVAAARFSPGQARKLTNSGKGYVAAVSPDGKYVAYVSHDEGKSSIRLMLVAAGRDVVLATNDKGYFWRLSFSPDGSYVYYVVQNFSDALSPATLHRVSVLGGDARKVSERVSSSPTFSPDGRLMAFVREGAPAEDECALVVASPDGSDERLLSVSRAPDWLAEPAWSPDGRTIVCILRDGALPALALGGAMKLVAVPLDGGERVAVGSQPWGAILQVAWLPGGDALVANAVDTESGKPQFWHVSYPDGAAQKVTSDLHGFSGVRLTADGSTLVTVQETQVSNLWVSADGVPAHAAQLTSGTGIFGGYYGLSWSPDGRRLVYSSTESGNWDIWAVDAEGRGRRRLTDDPHQEWGAQYTPDGRHVVFRSNREGRWNIYRMSADGENVVRLTSGVFDDFASCSPDGRWVFYMASVGDRFTLWKVPVEGGEPVQVTDKEVIGPSVSPDGRLVAGYYRERRGGPWTLAVLSAEDGRLVKTLESPINFNFGISWTRDGRGVNYLEGRDGPSNVWRQSLDGGPPQPVTDYKTEEVLSYAWSPDGRRFACARGSVTQDVVAITNAKN